MHPFTSPRLPGVPILKLGATGPDFSRWRRSVKFALETKGTWKYCTDACPMPMPETVSGGILAIVSRRNTEDDDQSSLLEQRRAWVRQDREVKLDLFLSLAEDVMQEVFGIGPPLPPSSLNAQQMMDALTERFAAFRFESYHHAFCHFLNLHIDQYDTLEDFKREFSTTLEDLVDHGHALSNMQACSAYLSKLRCTQNPWVVEKLEQWDTWFSEPRLVDLMDESPPWSIIRPLATKSSQHIHADSPIEEHDSLAQFDSDTTSEPSTNWTGSSGTSHSRSTSSTTAQSQEITIHATSEDIAVDTPRTFHNSIKAIPATIIPQRISSKVTATKIPTSGNTTDSSTTISDWLDDRKSQNIVAPACEAPAPVYVPITQQLQSETTRVSRRANETTTAPVEVDHAALRTNASRSSEDLPANIHPALRLSTPIPRPATTGRETAPNIPVLKSYQVAFPPLEIPEITPSSLWLAVPWPGTPEEIDQLPPSEAALRSYQDVQNSTELNDHGNELDPTQSGKSLYDNSTNSSLLSLPLQGTQGSAWDYLNEDIHLTTAPLSYRDNSPTSSQPTLPNPQAHIHVTAFPPINQLPLVDQHVRSKTTLQSPTKLRVSHGESTGAQLATRLSRDGLSESSEESRERRDKQRRKKGWSLGGNLTRFGHGKRVREIV